MDYSKAIAALYNKKGHPIKFRGFDKVKKPGIPCICIPTTAGTGSEASHNASFVDTKKLKWASMEIICLLNCQFLMLKM